MNPLQLERLHAIQRHRDIPVPHTGQAFWARDPLTQQQWVCKTAELAGADTLIAEIIGWYLGRSIGAPLPNAALLLTDPDGLSPAWLTETIPNAQHWSDAYLGILDNPEELGAILALDAILLNADRHERNLLLQESNGSWKVWCIDLGGAYCGSPPSFSQYDLETPDLSHHVRLTLPDKYKIDPRIIEGAQQAAQRATWLPDDNAMFQRWAEEACVVVGSTQASSLLRGLRHRCRHALEITRRHLQALQKQP